MVGASRKTNPSVHHTGPTSQYLSPGNLSEHLEKIGLRIHVYATTALALFNSVDPRDSLPKMENIEPPLESVIASPMKSRRYIESILFHCHSNIAVWSGDVGPPTQ